MKNAIRPFIYALIGLILVTGGYFLSKRIIYAQHIIQARKCEESRDYLEAIRIYRHELESNPDNIELYALIGNLYLKIGEEKKAKGIFMKGLEIQPGNFTFLNNVGILSFNEKDFKSAESHFKKALGQKPKDPSIHFYLARTLQEEKCGAAAEAEYRLALQYGYDKARVNYNLAFLYEYTLGNYEKALESYELYASGNGAQKESVEKKIENLRLWVEGQKFEDAGDLDKAITEYKKALEKEPKSMELLTRLGRVYRKSNKFPEAERTYIRALEIKPDDYYILNNLGSLYFSIDRLEDARDCWEQAIKAQPALPNAHFNMAILYEKKNKKEEAAKEYLLSLKYGYDSSTVYLHLGMLYESSDRAKAIEYYRKYISMNGPEKAGIARRIEALSNSR